MKTKVIADAKDAIRIAAKAGFVTKPIWCEFFARGKRRWHNRLWKRFADNNILAPVEDYGFIDSAVSLTEKGKALAVGFGYDPVFVPAAKNLWHDEELIRTALFMERQGWITNWMTEQELKCNGHVETLFKSQHRAPKIPDLIIEWRRAGKPVLWAVELERSRKEFTRYYDMVGAYRGISKIDSVLVIAATNSIEENIKKAQAKLNYPQSARPILFASLDELHRDPNSCEIRIGPKRTTLEKIAQALTGAVTDQITASGISTGPAPGPNGVFQNLNSKGV